MLKIYVCIHKITKILNDSCKISFKVFYCINFTVINIVLFMLFYVLKGQVLFVVYLFIYLFIFHLIRWKQAAKANEDRYRESGIILKAIFEG